MGKFLWKLNNKRKRMLRKFAAWILTSQAKSEMEKFGWNTLRGLIDVNGVFLVYYVCKEFKDTYNVPFGDNSVTLNGKRGLRDNGNQEATESFRRSDSDTDEDIQKAQHPSQDGSRDRHDRTVQDRDYGIQHSQTERCPSQC